MPKFTISVVNDIDSVLLNKGDFVYVEPTDRHGEVECQIAFSPALIGKINPELLICFKKAQTGPSEVRAEAQQIYKKLIEELSAALYDAGLVLRDELIKVQDLKRRQEFFENKDGQVDALEILRKIYEKS